MRTSTAFLLATTILLSAHASQAQTVLPEWVGRQSEAWRRTRTAQLPNRQALFRSSPRNAVPEGENLLVCRVHVDGRWDLFGDPDLAVQLRAGSTVHNVWGTENSRTEVFTFPGVNAQNGLRFRVTDRDVTFDEPIATVAVTPQASAPLAGEAGQAEVECRIVDATLVEPGVARALASARPLIDAVESARPNLQAEDLDRPSPSSARQQLVGAAAWGGWSHEQIANERRRLERAESDFDHALRDAVSTAWRAAPRLRRELVVDGQAISVQRAYTGTAATARVPPERRETGWVIHQVIALEGHVSRADVIDRSGHVHTPRSTLIDEQGATQLVFDHRVDTRRAVLRVGAARDGFLRLR